MTITLVPAIIEAPTVCELHLDPKSLQLKPYGLLGSLLEAKDGTCFCFCDERSKARNRWGHFL